MEKVAVLGPAGTNSAEAARKCFPKAELLYCETITDVFESVKNRKAANGVVAVENSIEGSIGETLKCLESYDLKIEGEVYLTIEHVLAGVGELKDIKVIYSHQQALAQCRDGLKRLFGKIPELRSNDESGRPLSTAGAMELVAGLRNKSVAAIGSRASAKRNGLEILSDSVSNEAYNETRFFIIGRNDCQPTGRDKTSIVVGIRDKPGALYELLGLFAKAGINLSKIESKPMRGKKWEYIFFIDLEGHEKDKKVAAVLKAVKESSTYFKILGSYPRY